MLAFSSPHARTYHVPEDGIAYETCAVAEWLPARVERLTVFVV
jgi:hypothetical protein